MPYKYQRPIACRRSLRRLISTKAGLGITGYASKGHVTRSMGSERCLSSRGHRRVASDWALHNFRQRGYQACLRLPAAMQVRSGLLGDPPPVLSRAEGPYRGGDNARTARQDSPLLPACVYVQAGRMDAFPVVKGSCYPAPLDSAEKPYECFDGAQHERKISNDFERSSVRPEALEG